jgi:hypothetical protein
MALEFVGQRIEALVVDLEFELLVKTVDHFRVDAVMDRSRAIDWFFGHRGTPPKEMRHPLVSNAHVSGVTIGAPAKAFWSEACPRA